MAETPPETCMAAPEHVPVRLADKARTGTPIPPAKAWKATRPGDLRPPAGRGELGRQGPDQGYALLLARRFEDRLVLAPGEHGRTRSPGAWPWPWPGRRCSAGLR